MSMVSMVCMYDQIWIDAKTLVGTCKSFKETTLKDAPSGVIEGHLHVHSVEAAGDGAHEGLIFSKGSVITANGTAMKRMDQFVQAGEPVYIWWNFLIPVSKNKK